MRGVKGWILSPQGFADGSIAVAQAMQALFGPVIDGRDTLQRKETCQAHGELVVEGMSRVLKVEALLSIVIVEERHKETAGLAVSGDHRAPHALAFRVQAREIQRTHWAKAL